MARAHTFPTVLGGLLALALTPAFWPGGATAQEACTTEAADLIADKTVVVGDINVCNDDTTLTVTYEPTSPWCLVSTNLHVATSESDIPQNGRGHPRPGQFDDGEDYDPCVDEATFEIPLAGIGDSGVEPGETVVVAAKATVLNQQTLAEAGAWGDGTRFTERGPWATYFTYEVQASFLCGGETSRCVFLTSSEPTGDLGGLDGADAICQGLAAAQGLPGSYKAWLSLLPSGPSPSDRFTHATVPYTRTDGVSIADDWLTLVDGGLDAPISVHEDGRPFDQGTDRVWTATDPHGGVPRGDIDCEGWANFDAGGQPVVGLAGSLDEDWSFAGTATSCRGLSRLYCFEQ